jgi:hypothetical protein
MFDTLTIGPKHVTMVICPKHGTHEHTITSAIPGHEGTWCMLCYLEMLGDPLPTTTQAPYETQDD